MTHLSIECIESAEGLSTLTDEWNRLFASTESHLPFWTFDWAATWWKHFHRNSAHVHDSPRIYVVRDAGGTLVAVAPMMLTVRSALGFLQTRSLVFLGADPNMTELKGVICADRDAVRVYRALLAHFSQNEPEWDWLEWSTVSEPCVELFSLRNDVESRRQVTGNVLSLASSWEDMKTGLTRNIRESLRKCYNSLKREGHEFEFHVASSSAEVAPSLEHLFRLHSARSAVLGTTPHANVFATEHSRLFLQEVCERLADKGNWRAFTMRISDEVVAIRLGFLFRETLYLYYSGFDPEWSRYSVMTTTVAEAIRHAISNGIKFVNLSTGRDVSKTRWGPTEVDYLDITLRSTKLRSRLAHYAYRCAFAVRSRLPVAT